MKNILYLTYLGFTFLLFNCHRAEDDVFDRERDFLKSVRVEGATKVVLDEETGTIEVTLPESYTKDILYLDLETYQDAALQLNSWDDLNSTNRVGMRYKGAAPAAFTVQRQDQQGTPTKLYKVYVEHLGKLTASLISDLRLSASSEAPYNAVEASLRLDSGVGTIPEKPGSTKQLVPKLTEQSSGTSVSGSHYASSQHFMISGAAPISLSSEYSLELEYGEKKFTFPGRQPLERAAVAAAPYELSSLFQVLPLNREILLGGGYFLSNLNYRVKVESDFHPSMWLTANYKNPSMLTFVLPSGTADGSYLISLYEGESLVKSFIFNVSNATNTKGIRNISLESLDCPSPALWEATPRNLSFQKGKSVFIAPFPAILGGFYAGFDPNKKLPDLELKNGQRSVILKAKTRADGCYADGTVQLYYGEYMIPADMAPGSYEARLLYEQSKSSIPFWTLITID